MGRKNDGENDSLCAITYLRKRVGYDEYLKEYCISRHLKITDLSEILSELEEAAKPYETMEGVVFTY